MGIKHFAFIGVGASTIAGAITGIYFTTKEKTIKDSLTTEGFELINIDADTKIWQIAWGEINDIPSLKSVENTLKDHNTLKTYCSTAYDKSLNDKNNLEKVKKICIRPSTNIRETLSRRGESLVSNWTTKLTSVKSQSGLLDKLKTVNGRLSTITENEDNQNALKTWCEARLNDELTVDGSKYKEVKNLCI